MPDHTQVAPGDLETVRRFINTWSIPNDTRLETDVLPQLAASATAWKRDLSARPRRGEDRLDLLGRLRSDLRALCEDPDAASGPLNEWFARTALSMEIPSAAGVTGLRIAPADTTFRAFILSAVANAILNNEWPRLKTCADCRWAFYDHTRNGSKRWCGMTKGGPDGRACGTIAKVGAYRARQLARLAGGGGH